MNEHKPHLLLTNDDGYDAEGIHYLSRILNNHGRVTVIAPDRECSGISHGFSLHHPLRLKRKKENEYSLSGTPADCVMFGLRGFIEDHDLPAFVFSGINHGANLGWDVIYSGTVAGALEGTLFNRPAVAVSLATEFSSPGHSGLHFETVVAFLERFLPLLLARKLPAGIFLNINVPNIPKEELRGHAFTRLGKRIYRDRVVIRTDPHGREYYWLGGEPPTYESEVETDFHALEQSLVSITPLRWKMSHLEDLDHFTDWRLAELQAEIPPGG